MGSAAASLIGGPVHYAICVALVVFALLARRSVGVRQTALLAASWLFYLTWGWPFLAVLIASSLLNYALGAVLRRKMTLTVLWTGVILNIALLAFFKYATADLAVDPRLGVLARFVQPVGISFWTLEALSYLFDLYHEEELDPSFLEFCLYLAFWPTVVVGPIMRLSTLLPQFRAPLSPTADDVSIGVSRVMIGAFMKLVVAEILGGGWTAAGGVNAGFSRSSWSGLDVLLLAIGFGWQLYFDFAGYSNIAIGAARLIGIRLDENFDHPFRSLTPAAFWTKWHISLSFWFRDYMFLPMATMRRGRWWAYVSLVVLMTVVGLWHHAAATFIAWGTYHGVLLVAHRVGQQIRRSLPFAVPQPFGRGLSWASTFVLVSIGWIFFRAASMTQATAMIGALARPATFFQVSMPLSYYAMLVGLACWSIFSRATGALRARRHTDVANERPRLAAFELFDLSAARVWWWLAPAAIVIGIVGGLAVHDLKPSAPRTPFMYTLF